MDSLKYLTSENIIFIGSILLICGVMLGKITYRLGLPLLLVFLLVGMGFGVDGLGIQFTDMAAAQFIGMIALCIILFSGGLDTKFKSVKPVIAPGITLATLGVLITALVTGLFVWWLSGMAWTNIHFALLPSILLAATMSSTDSASVFGILGAQKVGLKQNLRPMLELESGSNDPMAYMLTIMLIEAITIDTSLSVPTIIYELGVQFVVGCLAGFGMGKAIPWLIDRYKKLNAQSAEEADDQVSSMLSILTLAGAFLTFSIANGINGNGYLAVYICGIMIGNSKAPMKRGISRYMSGMSWLAQIVVFLMLGLLVNPHEMIDVAAVSIIISLFIMFIGRPLSVMICMLPFRKFTFKARALVSWVGLRGAVPIIFATYPVVAGVEGATQIFNIVFFVTLISLLVQGTTVVAAARKLHLTENPYNEDEFGVELSESLPTKLDAIKITKEMIAQGNTLRQMSMPAGSLVMMIKRDNNYIVPNGNIEIRPDDIFLIIKESPK